MPQLTPSTVSILPPLQSSGGSLKEKANAFRYNSRGSKDAELWSVAADAFSNAQSQIDTITNALRAPVPQPQVIQITNPSGVLVAQIGNTVGSNNQSYPGIWATDLYVGGSGPDTAPLFADGSQVSIGQNGQVFILDPFGNVGAWLGTQSESIKAVTGAAAATGLIRVTVVAHGYVDGDQVNIAAVGGVPNATGQWVINVITVDTFDLVGSTFAGIYTSGGTSQRFFAGGLFSTVAVGAAQRVTNVANNGAGLARVTVPTHGYSTGYAVVLSGVMGVPNINSVSWSVTVIDANNFDLVGSTFSGAYTSGGQSLNWPTAKLIARDDGSLTINGATFTLNGNGIVTTISNAPGSVGPWAAQAASLISLDVATSFYSEIDPFHVALATDIGTPVVWMENAAGVGTFTVTKQPSSHAGEGIYLDSTFNTVTCAGGSTAGRLSVLSPSGLDVSQAVGGHTVHIDDIGVTITHNSDIIDILSSQLTVTDGATTVTIDAGSVDSPLFSAGGVPGVTGSRAFGISLTVGTASVGGSLSVNTDATGVFGTPGVGQSNGTVVTGVTLNLITAVSSVSLNTEAHAWTGGLWTT